MAYLVHSFTHSKKNRKHSLKAKYDEIADTQSIVCITICICFQKICLPSFLVELILNVFSMNDDELLQKCLSCFRRIRLHFKRFSFLLHTIIFLAKVSFVLKLNPAALKLMSTFLGYNNCRTRWLI